MAGVERGLFKRKAQSLMVKVEIKDWPENSFEYRAAKWYFEDIKKNFPKLAPKSGFNAKLAREWSSYVAAIKVRCGASEDDIRNVFKFTRKDDFWCRQILSVVKFLRKNPDKLYYFDVMHQKYLDGQQKQAAVIPPRKINTSLPNL